MPSDNFKMLAQVQPGTSATTIYGAVPTNHETIVKSIHIVNNDDAARTITLFHADGATTATEATTILPAASIPTGGWALFEGTITMEAGDYLRGTASAASQITVTVYGDEIDIR